MRMGGPPVMLLVKKVLDALLAASPEPLTAPEVYAACGVDLTADAEVAKLVAANPKACYEPDSGCYAYVSVFKIRNKAELRALLFKRADGTSLAALADAYGRVRDDAAELVAEGAAWEIENLVTHDRVLFPREREYELPVDARIKAIWARVELPTEPEALSRELLRAGIVAAPRRSAFTRRVMPANTAERKKKRRRDFSKLHVTNVHLWDELFAPGCAADLPEDD
jgi:hypothetical protein